MKVLTVRQPYASLIIWGAKDIENRNWKTNYRGPVLIHAAAKLHSRYAELYRYPGEESPADMFTGSMWSCLNNHQRQCIFENNFPMGQIIGLANLVEIDHYWPGYTWAEMESKWHWVFSQPQEFIEGIPAKGKLNLWEYDNYELIENKLKNLKG